jgi:5-hydroxyisourate hydrolase-like protein (transthyretin family)
LTDAFQHRFDAGVAATGLAQSQSITPAQSDEKSAEKQAQLCTVSGRVVTAAEGAPIKSARLVLVQENAKNRPEIFGALTDGEGHFQIKDVPPGRYRFSASRTGFVAQQYQAKGTSQGAVLSLGPGQQIDDTLFRLVRAGVVSGRVIDEAGEPLANVWVSALRRPTEEEREDWSKGQKQHQFVQASGAKTDDRGEYRIFGLKPGDYYLKASESPDLDQVGNIDGSDNYFLLRQIVTEYAPLYYPGVLQISDAQAIPLRAGEEVRADFEMRRVKTVEVAGRVIGADGKPATHAYLLLGVPGVGDLGGDLEGSTDSKGEFLIKHVSPGSYILTAVQNDENRHEFTRQKLEVAESDLKSVILSFGRGTDIRGQIISQGSNPAIDRLGLGLESQDEDESISGAAQAKKDGTFLLADVPDGSYAVDVWDLEKGWFIKAIHYGSIDVLEKGLQVEHGSSSGTLEVVISSAGAEMEGTVNDQDGKPIVAAQVRMRPEPETSFNRTRAHTTGTDQNGHFSFSSLAAGKYKVWARSPSTFPEAPVANSESQTVTLSERDHQSIQLKIDLQKDSQ